MILLQANQVARRFADVTLYENVSFNIQTNDRIALVGRNGAGKSTLIQQIIGQEPINDGDISFARDIRIGYLEQHVRIDSNLTIWQDMESAFSETLALRNQATTVSQRVADLATSNNQEEYNEALADYDRLLNELDRRNAYGIESTIRTVLHGFRFYEKDYDTPVNDLSGGQKTRLALARILLMDYDLLILDEPTNHLDMETLTWLESYLNGYRGALLIVSHDRYFLNKVATQVIELAQGTAHLYKGNYDYYLTEKAARQEKAIKEYEKQEEKIKQLESFIDKNIVRASTTKRAQSRRKQLEKMDRIEKPQQDSKAPRIQFSTAKTSGNRVIEAQSLAIGYPDSAKPLAEDINFDLRRQEAIAVVGPNGIGKTTLLRTLIQEIPAIAGKILYGTNVDIGYYDQNVNQLDGSLTVLETLWRAHDTTDEWKVRSLLGSFLFTGETVEKKVSMLSGGEKARLSLALLAADHHNTLLLDEPTNHLDIDSKEVLEEALIRFDGTLLFVSHDRYFINRIATQVLELSPKGSRLFLGDYDYYLAKKEEIEAIEAMTRPDAKTSKEDVKTGGQAMDYQTLKALNREKRQLRKKIDEAWEKAEAIEAKIKLIDMDIIAASEAMETDRLMELDKTHKKLHKEYDDYLDQWEHYSLALHDFYAQHPALAE